MKVSYPGKNETCAKAQREMAAKSGTHKHEVFYLVGRIEKTPSQSAAVYVSHWRGDTTIELHECEKLLFDWRPSGTAIFIDVTLIDELIALLEQARQQARAIRAPKK